MSRLDEAAVPEEGPAETAASRPSVFITHPIFRQPGFGANHPLSIMRHGAVLDLCEAMDWLSPDTLRHAPLPDRDTLERFHTPDYLDALEASARALMATPAVRERYNVGTMECPLFAGLWDRARASVGGSILAAELAMQGRLAFHPGGGTHHGRPNRAAGFCYFNDPVFAVLRFLDAGLNRVLYVDLDAHHGDGVEAAFAADERVTLASIHEEGRWPGTGGLQDRPSRRVINLPVPRHVNDDEFLLVIQELCRRRLEGLQPEAVVVTCGADALRGDPLSSMEVSNKALAAAVQVSTSLARHAVVLGGGGYNPWTTARMWAGLWAQMSGKPIPDRLPPAAQDILARLSCDLVDDDDRDPAWLSSIADSANRGAVRARIYEVIDAALPIG
ncbi:MAG: acetoin utilization protein AcuC [Hyphomicrobiaceae bacterium]|nr:MAG: acetoin utilization protein AcuC [Hyphomicrobiaceae bacterium]